MSREVYVVQQGDTLVRIAKQHGFGDWRTIYNDPDNQDFRRKRPNPDQIFPGDELVIPNHEQREQGGCQTGQRHRFQLHRRSPLLRIAIKPGLLEPRRYRLEVAGRTHEGVLTGGVIEHRIPAEAEQGTLTIEAQGAQGQELHQWQLLIGHLDPIEEVTGAQGRLRNLGYYRGELSGEEDEATRQATKEFQKARRLQETGTLDERTKTALKEEHDGP